MSGLTKRFGGVTAVEAVSFEVAAGEAVAVIGPNGAGKSSLLKLLSGVYRPDEGTIIFGRHRLDQLPPNQVPRAGVALAHQIPRPFRGLTVWENVALGAGLRAGRGSATSVAEQVDQVLTQCGLASRARERADGLRLLDLKRLELARALSLDPDLILLDEVAAGLSGRELNDLIDLVRGIHQGGRSVVVVEHVEGVVASLVERVLVLDWGRLIAEGTPRQIAADPVVREVYLGGGPPAGSTRRPVPPPAVLPPGLDGQGSVPLLALQGLRVKYGDIEAVREVSLELRAGEVLAVLGANGAGKSSLASAISGAEPLCAGQIRLSGRDITAEPSHVRARRGIAHCPEGRKVFADLTIEENLCLAPPLRLPRPQLRGRLDAVHDLFPVLRDMASRRAGSLSGGQQQQLAIGRALMADPQLLVLDEISLGLAPVVIDDLYTGLQTIAERGIAVILIEQNVHRCLTVCDRVVVLDRGTVSYQGDPTALDDPAVLDRFYFGSPTAGPWPRRPHPVGAP